MRFARNYLIGNCRKPVMSMKKILKKTTIVTVQVGHDIVQGATYKQQQTVANHRGKYRKNSRNVSNNLL